MQTDAAIGQAIERLRAALLASQAADGGWGAYQNGPSAIEATAFAALALAAPVDAAPADAAPVADALARAVRFLVTLQRADGGWPVTRQVPESSWPTAPAVLALATLRREPEAVRRGVTWLTAREGVRVSRWALLRARLAGIDERRTNDLDATLRGWPWTDASFAWVEPTALAMLALRASLRAGDAPTADSARERLREGERLLVDRAVPGGGWNYGNRRVLDEDLEPYPDTTAWALLALRGSADVASVTAPGLHRLSVLMSSNGSPLARALAVLAFRAYGRAAGPLETALARQCGGVERRGEPAPTETRARALALLALASPRPALVT